MFRVIVSIGVLLAACAGAVADEAPRQELLGKIASARPVGGVYDALPSELLGKDLANAYRFQGELIELEERALGPRIGWKVGYASRAAQEQFGVDAPARGPLFLSSQVVGGSTIPASEFVEIMLETEVAFTIGKAIEAPVATVEELRPYVRFIHPALDASDYRFAAGLKPSPADMIATDLGSHRFVLGPGVPPGRVGVNAIRLKLSRNGEEIRDSSSSEVMGSPWRSLRWCVNHILSGVEGLPGEVPAGAVIVTGTADKAWKVTGDEIRGEYVGDCGPLGKVSVTIE